MVTDLGIWRIFAMKIFQDNRLEISSLLWELKDCITKKHIYPCKCPSQFMKANNSSAHFAINILHIQKVMIVLVVLVNIML